MLVSLVTPMMGVPWVLLGAGVVAVVVGVLVLLVLVLGAACVRVVGGSGGATRGWWLVGLWSWWGGAGCFGCWGGWCCGWLAVALCCRCRWCW